MPQTVYRVVSHNPPSESDYLTYAELGLKIRNPTPESLRWATGYSTLNSLQEARIRANGKPWLGHAYIGVYLLLENENFVIEQTGTNLVHYTVWCSSDFLRACLVEVVDIEEDSDNV